MNNALKPLLSEHRLAAKDLKVGDRVLIHRAEFHTWREETIETAEDRNSIIGDWEITDIYLLERPKQAFPAPTDILFMRLKGSGVFNKGYYSDGLFYSINQGRFLTPEEIEWFQHAEVKPVGEAISPEDCE